MCVFGVTSRQLHANSSSIFNIDLLFSKSGKII